MTVANTIWRQIGIQTKMACGAREPMGDANSLTFRVTIKPNQRHKIVVTLDPSDTYTVKLYSVRNGEVKVVEEADDIYCEVLSEVIYRMCNK